MTVNNVLEIASKEVMVEGNRPLGRPSRVWKNYIKGFLQKFVIKAWTELIWLRIGAGVGRGFS
jgi:hypothetical protein